jgi:hypothetical protein
MVPMPDALPLIGVTLCLDHMLSESSSRLPLRGFEVPQQPGEDLLIHAMRHRRMEKAVGHTQASEHRFKRVQASRGLPDTS